MNIYLIKYREQFVFIFFYNIMTNKKIYYILFIIIIILLILIYLKKNNYEFFSNYTNYNFMHHDMTYFRCKDKVLGQITKMVFDDNNIYNDNSNWTIYIPCGYNNVERELFELEIPNNKIKQRYIFGINGCDAIVAKNQIWDSLVKCYGRDGAMKLMPESYLLYDENDLALFQKNYSHNDIYIMKKNVQRKEGLKLTQDMNDVLNGIYDDYKVAQKYIRNMYLVNGRKVNLRIYLLVVIKNGIKYFYISNIGKCIYTKKEYNDSDLDFESNITSYHLDVSIYKTNPRYFNELINYINKNNSNKSDNNFVSENGKILFKRIDDLLQSVSKCLANSLYQSENIKKHGITSFQLFGLDVIFNDKFQPFLLEINKGPDMSAKDDEDTIMKYRVQYDMFRTVGIINKFMDNETNSFKLIYKS